MDCTRNCLQFQRFVRSVGHLRPCKAWALFADALDGPTASQAFLRCRCTVYTGFPSEGWSVYSRKAVQITPLLPSLHAFPAWACACPPRPWHGGGRPGRQDIGEVLLDDVHVVDQPNARVVQRRARGAAASGFACYFLQISLAFTGRVLPGDRWE